MKKKPNKKLGFYFLSAYLVCMVGTTGLCVAQWVPPTPVRPTVAPPSKSGDTKAVENKEKKKEELPQKGVLSTTVTKSYKNAKLDIPWGSTDAVGGGVSPITGSVSRFSEKEWLVKVFNNSDKRYSFNVKVTQYSDRGSQVKSDSFSYTLKPKESVDRKLSRSSGARDAQLSLEGWKALDK